MTGYETATGRDVGAELRRVAGAFPTGVTVLTTVTDGKPIGMAANSFTSLSLTPPLVLVCIARSSTTWPSIAASGRFCVNILAADQEPLARGFAVKGADRFLDVQHTPSTGGMPLLTGAIGFIDCKISRVHDGGDHLVVIAAVDDLGTLRDEAPLVFHRSGYGIDGTPVLTTAGAALPTAAEA